MTTLELKAFREVLESKQAELGGAIWNREALAINTSPEELDRIQQASDRDWAMRDLERNSNRLHEVRAALERMDAGAFGVCSGCEETIQPKRLNAVPWALRCIICQEAADLNGLENEVETPLVMAA